MIVCVFDCLLILCQHSLLASFVMGLDFFYCDCNVILFKMEKSEEFFKKRRFRSS